jgi:mono/diheme cytochrome c family protein
VTGQWEKKSNAQKKGLSALAGWDCVPVSSVVNVRPLSTGDFMAKKLPMLVFALALVAAACGGGSSTETPATTSPAEQSTEAPSGGGDVAAGEKIYVGTCAACHAPDGTGVTGLGKPIVGSEFVAGLSEQELVDFIKVGRDPGDPANTTGVGMPPKGGNPSLSDSDIADVVSYIKSIN